MFYKTKNKNKNTFAGVVYSVLVVKMYWQHKEVCFSINGGQYVRLVKETIDLKIYFKQMPVPFKIYAHFECKLKSADSFESFYSKKNIKITFLVVLLTKLFVSMINLLSQYLLLEVKMLPMNLLKQFLKRISIVKKIMKKYFSKNLIMSEKEEEQFQPSNICWISEKLIDDDDEKIRDHCYVTGKFRCAAHWSCNINLQLTKKVPVLSHNLRGYDIHLTFCELKKIDMKINVIRNRLEKHMAFF